MALFETLNDFKIKQMPERKSRFWQMAGPGAILVGLSIGAGEIIIWPRLVAEYGADMVWAAVLGVFLQMWINLEVGRWTVATGETVFTGFARIWRGFAPIFILLTVFSWIAPGWGRASGLALKALLVGPDGFGSDTFWTSVTFAGCALLLFGPKVIYGSVEKSVELLVLIVTVGLIFVALGVGTADTWGSLFRGAINFGYKHPQVTVKQMFIAIVFAGAGGTANLFYTFYLRDKHIGMGVHLPSMENPLRGRTEKVPTTGFRYEETEENASRFQAWWDYIKKDQMLFFWALNTVTMILFIFGSLAVLHPRGIVPASGTLIWDEAQILGEVWGPAGRTVFLLVGLATLFGTQLALIDGVSRSIADILSTNFSFAKSRNTNWWYVLIAALWMVAGCVITYVMEAQGVTELGFLFNAAYIGGFAMAIYVPLLLIGNRKFLPDSAKPGAWCTIMMTIASIVYVAFAVSCLIWEFTG